MQTFNIIMQMRADGTLGHLIRLGLIAPKVVLYADMFARVEERKKRFKRTTHKHIIIQVADEYNVHPTTVYRAIGIMKSNMPVSLANVTI